MTLESPPGEYPDRDPQMFYELARERHAAQAETLSVLDGKLGLLLSTSSARLGILVAVYALRPSAFDATAKTLFVASGAAWVVLAAFAVHALWHRPWKSGPLLQKVFNLHFSEDEDRLKWRVANAFWHDYNHNQGHEERKARALHWALRLFVLQTALVVVALFLVAMSDSDKTRHSRYLGPAVRGAPVLAPAAECPRVLESADLPHSSIRGA